MATVQPADLKRILQQLRMQDLQTLLVSNSMSKHGRKDVLVDRACRLVDEFNHSGRNGKLERTILEMYSAEQRKTMPASQQRSNLPGLPGLQGNMLNVQAIVNQVAQQRGIPQQPYNNQRQQHMYRMNHNVPQQGSFVPIGQASGNIHVRNQPTFDQHPDVKLKVLPFFDVKDIICKVTSIVPRMDTKLQETIMAFYLSANHAHEVTLNRVMKPHGNGMWICEFGVQIQLRFSLLDTSKEQDDKLLPNIQIRVNDKQVTLPPPLPAKRPNEEPRRPGRPIDITPQCRLSPNVTNTIRVTWNAHDSTAWTWSLWLVSVNNSDILLDRLKKKGIRAAGHTRAFVKQKLATTADTEIALSSLQISLCCPIGKSRMKCPVRCPDCRHLQCFDAPIYLQMNEKKPSWRCPVCDHEAQYKHLYIDGLTQEILAKTPEDVNEIEFLADGSWREARPSNTINLSDVEDVSTPAKPVQPKIEADTNCNKESPEKLLVSAPAAGKVIEENDYIIVIDSADEESESEQEADDPYDSFDDSSPEAPPPKKIRKFVDKRRGDEKDDFLAGILGENAVDEYLKLASDRAQGDVISLE